MTNFLQETKKINATSLKNFNISGYYINYTSITIPLVICAIIALVAIIGGIFYWWKKCRTERLHSNEDMHLSNSNEDQQV